MHPDAGGDEWNDYLAGFHAERPGITAAVLTAATDGDGHTPYGWVTDALPKDGVVVDVACGNGPLSASLPGNWIGFDRSASELERAGPVAAGRAVVADAAAAPLGSGGLDAVVCSMALMVLDDPAAAVVEMARVLRVGGHLVALVPTRSPLGLRDRLRYIRLLSALRLPDLPFRHHQVLRDPQSLFAGTGLAVSADQSRRFVYPLTSTEAADLLIRSLYLPHLGPRRLRSAQRVARRWVGSSIGIPLRRLVATKVS